MPSKKSSKKNLLKGAIKDELKGAGIMQDFMKNITNDKDSEVEKEAVAEKPKKEKKSAVKTASPPPKPPVRKIRNSGSREWWISFSSFITIVLIVLGLYFLSNRPAPSTFIYVSNHPVNVLAVQMHTQPPKVSAGESVFCYYISDRGIDTQIIEVQIYKLRGMEAGELLATSTFTVKPSWKVFETMIEKKQFPEPGRYKIVIRDERKSVIAEQSLLVSR